MSATQLTVMRYLAAPVALVLLLSWLWLPSRLQLSQSVETTATFSRGTFKGQEVVYLQTATHGELRFPCAEVAPLCSSGAPPPLAKLRVWLQDPGVLYARWVVAAEHDGKSLVTAQSQASAYGQAKVLWGFGTLVAVAVALVLWYFGPFKEPPDRAA